MSTKNELKPIHAAVTLFPNGQCRVIGDGLEIPELQYTWAHLWAAHCVAQGYNPDCVIFEATDGRRWMIHDDQKGGWSMQQLPTTGEMGIGLN